MSFAELRDKIEKAVTKAVGGTVDIEETRVGNVHVLAVSPRFRGLSYSQREYLIWPAFEEALTEDELLRISVCLLQTPEEHQELTA